MNSLAPTKPANSNRTFIQNNPWMSPDGGFEKSSETIDSLEEQKRREQNEYDIHKSWDNVLSPTIEVENTVQPVQARKTEILIGDLKEIRFNSNVEVIREETVEVSESRPAWEKYISPPVETPKLNKSDNLSEPKKVSIVENEYLNLPVFWDFLMDGIKKTSKKLQENSKEVVTALIELYTLITGLGEKAPKKVEKATEKAGDKPQKKPNHIKNLVNLLNPPMSEERKRQLQIQRADVNKQLGFSESYLDSVNDSGVIRSDLESLLAKAAKDREDEKKKAQTIAPPKKKRSGPGVIFDLNKSAESQNSVTQLKG